MLGTVVERVSDIGQWFNDGIRVEYFPRAGGRLQSALEPAALGPYEVLTCIRVQADGKRWLDVRLQRVVPHAPSAHQQHVRGLRSARQRQQLAVDRHP